MPPESNMFAAKAEDSSKNTIDDHREAVERSLASLKQAAATAETEEELDAIHAKMLQLTEEYKTTAAQAHDDEHVAELNIGEGSAMTFTDWQGRKPASTGEQEKFGLHVGQKLKLTAKGKAQFDMMNLRAKTLVIVGFAQDLDEKVLVQIDGDRICRAFREDME